MKKWIVCSILILIAILLFIGIIPFEKEISYSATDYEFALAEDGAVASHEVRIEGKYYTTLLLKDRFWGTFYVSDVEGLTEEMSVDFAFEPTERYHPVFLGEAKQPHSTEIGVIFFERNFEQLAIQFTYKYEKDEDSITAGYGDGISNFLVLGATNKEEALLEYTRMLQEKPPKR